MMRLIYIYGPPGVGKLTVAEALAERTGFKVAHNHLSIAAIQPLFEFGTPTFWRLVHQIRYDVLAAAAQDGIDLIQTNVYDYLGDTQRVEWYFSAVEGHGGVVYPVQLQCEMPELERRVDADRRREMRKIATVEALRQNFAQYDLRTPLPNRDSLRIDNTRISPQEAADRIIQHYQLPVA